MRRAGQLLWLGLFVSVPAGAVEPRFEIEARAVGHGYLRPLGTTVDPAGFGQEAWIEQLIRPRIHVGSDANVWSFDLELELFSGLVAGQTSRIGEGKLLFPRAHLDGWRPDPLWAGGGVRRAAFRYSWAEGEHEIQIGRRLRHQGFGIVYNDGAHLAEFGYPRLGDIADGIVYAFQAARHRLSIAIEFPWRDSLVLPRPVWEAVEVSALYRWERPNRSAWFEVMTSARRQADALSGADTFWTLDVSAQWPWVLDALFMTLGGEAFVRVGSSGDGTSFGSAGGLVRGSIGNRDLGPRLVVDVGVAAGAGDARWTTAFHPDYVVGGMLFPEVLNALTARAAPAGAATLLPTSSAILAANGGVSNAFYVWPRIVGRPLITFLEIRFGLLAAWALSEELLAEVSTRVPGRFLGVEAMGALRFTGRTAGAGLGFELGLDVSFFHSNRLTGGPLAYHALVGLTLLSPCR